MSLADGVRVAFRRSRAQTESDSMAQVNDEPYETPAELIAGIASTSLLTQPATWVNRRVETIRVAVARGDTASGVD